MMDAVIKRIQQSSKEIFQVESEPIVQIVYMRDHPCSTVAKLKIDIGNRIFNLFAKHYRFPEIKISIEKMEREYKILTLLNEKEFLSSECSVIRPLACFPDLQTIITFEWPGEAFNSILKRGIRILSNFTGVSQLEDYCRLCGQWLREFQQITENINCRPYNHEDMITDIHSKLRLAAQSKLLIGAQADWLIRFVDNMNSSLPGNIRLSGMHSDFIPSNILVHEGEIVVLDFADFRKGPIYRDPITFIHALSNYIWTPLVRQRIIRSLQKQFLIGYGTRIYMQDIPLVSILEIRQVLGELFHLPVTIKKGLLSAAASARAKSILTKRLKDIIWNAENAKDSYSICGVVWDIQS